LQQVIGEEFMRLKIGTGIAVIAALGLLALPAGAQTKRKVATVDSHGQTVFTSRDEDGKTRTRVIIQKRSYLDPGTEAYPGEHSGHEYAYLPGQHPMDVMDKTVFGQYTTSLPGPYTLPGKNNPWLGY
jgi:hypothetical protein